MQLRTWFESIADDVWFALRSYRRSPGFMLTALVAIALGVGATTAVFSVVDRVLFRSLPYHNANRLVSLGMIAKVVGDDEFLFAADYKDLLEEKGPFQSLTSWSGVNDCDITDRAPARQRCAEVESNFLHVFGIKPILGESFSKEDGQPNAPRKVMLSYRLWQSRFGGDTRVAGKTLSLDGTPARIAGVLPASFELPTLEQSDLLIPQIVLDAGWQHGATRVLWAYGQLKDGVTLKQARSQLAPAFARILSYVPAPFRKEVQFRVRSLRDREMQGAKTASWTLFGSVMAVMLISCANVANLLLARSAGRQRELAIREALGVSRARLMRQMIVESLPLALAGGVLGCGLAAALLRVLIAMAPHGVPHLANASLDSRVLAFSLGASIFSGLLFGLAPAMQKPRTEALGSSRSTAPKSSARLKNLLVAGQIAISTVLLASAGLLVRSLWNLESQPLGMHAERVLTAQLILPVSRYTKPEERIAFFNLVEQQIGWIPGVRVIGLSDSLPPGGWERARPLFAIEVKGHPQHGTGTGGMVAWRYVNPGYFTALRIPVLEGSAFTEEDRRPGDDLVIVSRSLARRLFPGQDAVGQHLRFGPDGAWKRVVGIAADVKNAGLAPRDDPEYYVLRSRIPDDTYLHSTGPVAQLTLSILLRSAIRDATLTELVRRRIAALDGSLPVEFKSMRRRLSEMTEQPRFDAVLLVLFAAVGVLLAAVGLYGTVSFLVAQRTQEIGIRMSLGATPLRIAWSMLGEAAQWALSGAATGALAATVTTRLLSSLLFGVSARDPLTLAGSIALLLVVAMLATANPARKAAAIDPMIALREG